MRCLESRFGDTSPGPDREVRSIAAKDRAKPAEVANDRRFRASALATTFLCAALGGALAAQVPDQSRIFDDATAAAGVTFQHFNAEEGELDLPEITGPGGAFFDRDGDGDLDLYLVQGASLRPRSAPRGGDRILDNQLIEGGRLSFVDVTERVGLKAEGYGMGVATGDIDNDGDLDLLVLNFGANQLWRNDGERFSDVTSRSDPELAGSSWSIAASFVDYDRDGWLDVYVVNYTVYPIDPPVRCYASSSRRDYCGPSAFEPASDRLFRNRGNGTFEDVSGAAGITRSLGPGLGVVAADFSGDQWPDLYVANDGAANFLWINSGQGTFREEALLAGLALNQMGQPEASMGVALDDFDRDGDDDLLLTHLDGESNTFYLNQGDGLWEDRTIEISMAVPSRARTGFGAAWLDIDNDGWLDLAAVNGRVRLPEKATGAGRSSDLVQPNQLWRNRGGKTLEDISALAGVGFVGPEVSRGLAVGDVDNDGDADLLLLNNGGPARLLVNRLGSRQPWLGVVAKERKRDAFGARVVLSRGGDLTSARRVHTDGSYASAHDPRVLFGLGSSRQDASTEKDSDTITITWLDGAIEWWPATAPGRYSVLERGSGRSGPPPAAKTRDPR